MTPCASRVSYAKVSIAIGAAATDGTFSPSRACIVDYEYWLFGATMRYSGACTQCEDHHDYCWRCVGAGWHMVSMEEGIRV